MDHKDLIRAAECCDLKDCEACPSKGRVCCRERTMQELAAALKNEILRAEAAEADNERLREAIKPNCLMCESMHPDNGNCTEVGGFCTAVSTAERTTDAGHSHRRSPERLADGMRKTSERRPDRT